MSEVADLYEVIDGVVILDVVLEPGSGRPVVVGRHGHALKVRVPASPTGERANHAVTTFLAHELGLEEADVAVSAGERARAKRIRLGGLDPDDADSVLRTLLPGAPPGGANRPSLNR
jgi:uncharacterized protein YggU (UPF0235/DUF167 family)